MSLTDDPNDPRIQRGPPDKTPREQNDTYLVLPESERAKGFVRPFRDTYRHVECSVAPNGITKMGEALSATYARDPSFYGATYCVHCRMHKPVGEFVWDKDLQVVGS